MKKGNQIILLGILVLTLLLFVGGYVYLHVYIKKKIASAENVIAEIENEKSSQQNILGLKRSIEVTKEKNKLLDSYFVRENEVVYFIESLESLAKENAVTIEIDSIQQGQQIGKQGLYLTLSVNGDFSNVNNFILKLENMPYQTSITKILLTTEKVTPKAPVADMSGVKPSSTSSKWNASLDLVLISYIQE